MSEELVTPVTGTPEPQLTVVPAPATPQPDVVPQQKGRTLLVVIAEPEALTTARRIAQTPADAEERMAVRDVTPIKKILRQVKLIKEGDGLALKGDEERGLLSRAYQEVKQNLKQDKPEKR